MINEKTNWQKGDVITAEKLNNIENELEALDDRVFIVNHTALHNAHRGIKPRLNHVTKANEIVLRGAKAPLFYKERK